MSRFADPARTERLVLGPCACPGTPHDEDWMDLRSEVGAEDVLRLQAGGVASLEVLVVRWNLLDNDGSAAAVDREHLSRLFVDTFEPIDAWTKKHLRLSTLPNGSGARSRNGTRASAGLTRTTPTSG